MKNIFKFLVEKQLRVQSTLLWVIALVNLSSDRFWLFAIPAIISAGMQDILEEVRKLNKNKTDELL